MNTPFTKQQIEDLPKGFTSSEMPNRSFMRLLKRKLLAFNTATNSFYRVYTPNCRKLTKGRFDFKQNTYGRVNGIA